MKRTVRLLISLIIAIQITGFFVGMLYSTKTCREGIIPFKEMIDRDKSDKIALLSGIMMYYGFKAGSYAINAFRICGKVTVQQLDR